MVAGLAGGNFEISKKENEMEVIWRTEYVKLRQGFNDDSVIITDYGSEVEIDKSELTALAMEWLSEQGYDVVKREPEIKACPVCGELSYRVGDTEQYNTTFYYIYCLNCKIRTDGYLDKDVLIEAWNALPRK